MSTGCGQNMKNNSGQVDPPKEASKTRRLFLWLFNPRAWGDWERTKSTAQYFLAMIERFFVLRKKSKKYAETFDGAVAKFDLDEEALKAKALGLKRLSYSLLIMAFVLFSYAIYHQFRIKHLETEKQKNEPGNSTLDWGLTDLSGLSLNFK